MDTRNSRQMLVRSSPRVLQQGRRSTPKPRSRPRYQHKESAQILAIETIAKLCVNGLLAIVAIVALVRLVSYNVAQRDKLQLLEAEVQASQSQLDAERDDFSYHFDPTQGRNIMQDQSYRVEPGQAQIVFSPAVDSSESDPSGASAVRESSPVQTRSSESEPMSEDPSEASLTPGEPGEPSTVQPSSPLDDSEATRNPESSQTP